MTTITALPTAPNPNDGQTAFDDAADAWAAALPGFVSEANALAAGLNSLAAGTAYALPYTFSTTTTDSDPGAGVLRLDNATQNAATTIRIDTTDSAGSDQTAVIATMDDSTSTIKGFIKLVQISDASKWLLFSISALATPSGYRNITVSNVGGSAASPFANSAGLVMLFTRNGDKGDTGTPGASGSQTLVERSSNTVLTNADKGKLIKATGTFTQTWDAVATFDADFFIDYEIASGFEVTQDPNGAEQIDGRTSYIMYSRERRRIRKTAAGTGLESSILAPFYKVWTATTASAPIPPGYSYFGGLVWGGGGGGGKGNGSRGAGGGGGGACVPFDIPASSFGTTENITIAGTAAGATVTGAGTQGSNTTLGSLVTAYGGGGGFGGASGGSGGGGGGATSAGATAGGIVAVAGGNPLGTAGAGNSGFGGAGSAAVPSVGLDAFYGGASGASISTGDASLAGGAATYGGGGGAAGSATLAASGGASKFGGSGGAGGPAATVGGDGVAPGGGGGGTYNGANGGAGARGEVRMWGIV